ncbi:hypothetical protein LN042_35705 [Kitasatospora sp. RB6PN24]|uniref:hypothetical protein n=1 Tax=Kitasatospora humi TaxID=2893891 RepID=UPI001E5A5430|nr:hypothetical protein [Kitasatospora humi]MCC9312344.1 hypothetical protein [Kitasatospora humi]
MPRNTASNTQPAGSAGQSRVCPACRTGFSVSNPSSRQVYCSPSCRAEGRVPELVTRTCPVCEAEFSTTYPPRRQYCSHECRMESRHSEVAMDTRVCPVCEAEFPVEKTVRRIYCGADCRLEAERRREQEREEDRARRLGESPRPSTELPAPAASPPPRPSRTYSPARDPLEPAATRNCPHCDQPITIVALLATPEAARPAIHHRITDLPQLRRIP